MKISPTSTRTRLVFIVLIANAAGSSLFVSPLATPIQTARPFELMKSPPPPPPPSEAAAATAKSTASQNEAIISNDDGTLASLFGSEENRDTFFRCYFGTRNPVHIHRSDFSRSDDNDGGALPLPDIMLHNTLPCLNVDMRDLFDSSPYVTLRENGVPKAVDKSTMDWNDFLEQIRNGCSAVAPVVLDEAFASLRRSLETAFSPKTVSMTIYHSGPKASALLPHTDSYDVFVVQVEGCKDWEIVQGCADTQKATRFTLQPGDLLYIPYNVIHSARTTTGFDFSTHLTLGLLTGWKAEDTLNYAKYINSK